MSQICPSINPEVRVSQLFESISQRYAHTSAKERSPLYQNHYGLCKKAILEAAKGLRGTALILGAGGCHDIPLEELSCQFDRVTIVDFDLSLAEKAVQSVSAALRGKIEIRKADLAGIWEEFSSRAEALATSVSKEAFNEKLVELLSETIAHRKKFDYPEKTAQFVVSSLLSSQLAHFVTEYLTALTARVYRESFCMPEGKVWAWAASLSGIEENHMRDLHSWVDLTGKVCFIDHFFMTMQVVFKSNPTNSAEYLRCSSKKIPFFYYAQGRKAMGELFQISNLNTWEWHLPWTWLEEGRAHFDRTYKALSVFSHTLFPKKLGTP